MTENNNKDREFNQIKVIVDSIENAFLDSAQNWQRYPYIKTEAIDNDGHMLPTIKRDMVSSIQQAIELIHGKFEGNDGNGIDRHKLLSAVIVHLLVKPLFHSTKDDDCVESAWFHKYPNEAFIFGTVRSILSNYNRKLRSGGAIKYPDEYIFDFPQFFYGEDGEKHDVEKNFLSLLKDARKTIETIVADGGNPLSSFPYFAVSSLLWLLEVANDSAKYDMGSVYYPSSRFDSDTYIRDILIKLFNEYEISTLSGFPSIENGIEYIIKLINYNQSEQRIQADLQMYSKRCHDETDSHRSENSIIGLAYSLIKAMLYMQRHCDSTDTTSANNFSIDAVADMCWNFLYQQFCSCAYRNQNEYSKMIHPILFQELSSAFKRTVKNSTHNISVLSPDYIRALYEVYIEKARNYTSGLTTRLLSRVAFRQQILRMITISTSTDGCFGLVYFDLDNFKQVNDCNSHSYGNDCLIQVAGIISDVCDEFRGFAGRDGGEEIIIAVPDIKTSTLREMTEKINHKLNKIERQFTNDDEREKAAFYKKLQENNTFDDIQKRFLSASMGYGVVNNSMISNEEDLGKYISALDARCADAKHQGRNQSLEVVDYACGER
jgi:diguanylate cyclase (GGDEF)-like protein